MQGKQYIHDTGPSDYIITLVQLKPRLSNSGAPLYSFIFWN